MLSQCVRENKHRGLLFNFKTLALSMSRALTPFHCIEHRRWGSYLESAKNLPVFIRGVRLMGHIQVWKSKHFNFKGLNKT